MIQRFIALSRERKWEIILLCGIIAIGVFFRTYHFSDWLLFEIDQTYDTRIVSRAIEQGIEELPLLGPTAGGGRALRLGPAFYYMEYGSAFLFGDTPVGHALLVLILSILSLPLFYIFSRRYFNTSLSLILLALFSISSFLIFYGRFSWSPNVLPFLILLSFYALLRSVSSSETDRKRSQFFLLAILAIAITSQIHFNAFFTIPTITALFLLYKRPRFPLKIWFVALVIIATIYSPMVLSDIATHGENTSFFLKKISKTGGSPLDTFKNFPKKLIADIQYTASEYFLIDSGSDHINGGRLKGYGFQNTPDLPWRILALVLLMIEIIILVGNMRKETNPQKKDFLALILLWICIPFFYFYSLISGNFQIYPRFALLIAPLPIILLGLFLKKILPEKNIWWRGGIIIIVFSLFLSNVQKLNAYFQQMETPYASRNPIETEDIFPNNARLTLKEQLSITDFLTQQQNKDSFPIYISTLHEYEPVFWYHLGKKGISYSGSFDENNLYANGHYFLIRFSRDGRGRIFSESCTVSEKKDFGVLTVYTLEPKQDKIKALQQSPEDKKSLDQTKQIQALTTWKSIFNK